MQYGNQDDEGWELNLNAKVMVMTVLWRFDAGLAGFLFRLNAQWFTIPGNKS